MKNLIIIFIFTTLSSWSQVGIGNTDPKANLDISASNSITPSNTDGILIPRVDAFPTPTPTIDQNGMLIFITGNSTPTKGFYYWDNSLPNWVALGNDTNTQNTLDNAYNEGGAGLGKNIIANSGAVTISGEDGLLITGTFNTGDLVASGSGTKMFFNPNKAAFRAGGINGTQWDDTNIGDYSFAANQSTTASGTRSFAINSSAVASGGNSFAQGTASTASGTAAAAFGNATASGNQSLATGQTTIASGTNASSFGRNSVAPSYAEMAIGSFPRTYAATDANAFNTTDRAFVIGNGTGVGTQSSNAFEVWKDGRVEINEAYSLPLVDGTVGQILGTDGAGQLSFVNSTSGAQKIDDLSDGKSDTAGSSIFLGQDAGFNDDGSSNRNSSLGYQSLYSNISGSENIAIGNFSGQLSTGSGNVFLGFRAGSTATGNSKLFIENSGTLQPLIFGDFSSNEVGINWNSGTALPNTLSVNGNASKSVAGAWLANSDKRLKKNITTINSSEALNKLLQLRGVTYKWNDTKTGIERPKNIQYGFIAQELMQVFPTKVTKDSLGYYQTAYGDYDAFFVQAIKELNSKIETLCEENKKLKQQLSNYQTLEARLTTLEQLNKTQSN